jgi:hypothetical protein
VTFGQFSADQHPEQGACEHHGQDSVSDVGSYFYEAKRTLSATPELMLRIFLVIEMVYYLVNDF